MLISLTGTPGTGKHTIGKLLAEKLGYDFVDVGKIINKNEKTEVSISTNGLNRAVKPFLTNDKIFVSHLAHFIMPSKIDLVIVLRCDPFKLIKRLYARHYPKNKVYDNAIFEAIDGTYIEAIKLNRKVIQIDDSDSKIRTVNTILNYLKNGKVPQFDRDYSKDIIKIEKIFKTVK